MFLRRQPSIRASAAVLTLCACAALNQSCSRSASQHVQARSAPASAPQPAETPQFRAPPPQFAGLVERARAAAHASATPHTDAALPRSLLDLDWNAYRNIDFVKSKSLWFGERYSAEFFHLGYLYRAPVHVFLVDGDTVRPYAFDPSMFTYGNVPVPPAGTDLGFAGVRLLTFLNSENEQNELTVFQGASYFRPLARGQAFGLSGRGLAIDTGEPGAEEFPRFTEFYLVHPAADAQHVSVLALLDSPRATGAYAFDITPGETTLVDITAQIFVREPVKVLGLSPLTSMYLFGEDEPARFGDSRPEVHDSDALAMYAQNGERIVRPLRNPPRTTVSSFRLDSPRGFGLVQRDRKFSSYEDLVERYQERPSAWIEPQGDWGKGVVRMQEMATPLETDDNIAVMWVPDVVPAEGLRIAYRMHVGSDIPGVEAFGHAVATRVTRTDPARARFTVDFALPSVPAGELTLDVTSAQGSVLSRSVVPYPAAHGVRASFEVQRPDVARDVELRAFLRSGDNVLSETWIYLWPGKI